MELLFYCPELRLAIEIDGAHHAAVWMSDHDSERTAFLTSYNIEVVRITNELLAKNSVIAGETIDEAIRRRTDEKVEAESQVARPLTRPGT